MSSTLSSTRSEFSAGPWPAKPSVDATLVPADLENDRSPSKWPLGKRASRAIAFLTTFCIGIAATLAWQSSREMIAAPQAAPVAQTTPDLIAPAASAAPSPDLEQRLEATSLGFAAVRESVDQLAAGQERMTRDINNILDKISATSPRPATAPARNPVPLTPPSQARPVR